ncbi:golgin candidate 5-like [Quercus lobata]|uniref:golgin candidate 5-like n=1 Tax=Quercus lobata TaxID=97700 RepID=UPI00124533CC|nr:golgin candidate 5-like [Quercus lobata]XP_030938900.1 golgin candidate 5-like [Quercus lobata]
MKKKMAWFGGRVSLGNFPDLAGAVNKLQESVKNIEKNFDNALGFEEKSGDNSESTTEVRMLSPWSLSCTTAMFLLLVYRSIILDCCIVQELLLH